MGGRVKTTKQRERGKGLEPFASVVAFCLEEPTRKGASSEEHAVPLGELADAIGEPSNSIAQALFGMESAGFAVMPRYVGRKGIRVWLANRRELETQLAWLRDEAESVKEQIDDLTALIGRMDPDGPTRHWTDSAASGEKIVHAG